MRHITWEVRTLIEALNSGRPAQLPGYRPKYLNCNCPAANEHRLKPLWTTSVRASPGKSLGGFRVARGPAPYVFPCGTNMRKSGSWRERGQHRLAERAGVADRNFWVSAFLQASERRHGFFTIRRHGALTIELRSRGCTGYQNLKFPGSGAIRRQ